MQPVSSVLAPAEIYEYAVATAVHKAALPLPKLVLMGIASGMWVLPWGCGCWRGLPRRFHAGCLLPFPALLHAPPLPKATHLLLAPAHLSPSCERSTYPHSRPPTHTPSPLPLLLPPVCRFIGLGFSTCALVGGTLSPEFRKAQPGAFAALHS